MNYGHNETGFGRGSTSRHNANARKDTVNAKNHSQSKKYSEQEFSKDNFEKYTQNSYGNQQKNSADPISSLLSGIFQGGKLDSDKLMIMALIIVLAREGADMKLLIALGYILI